MEAVSQRAKSKSLHTNSFNLWTLLHLRKHFEHSLRNMGSRLWMCSLAEELHNGSHSACSSAQCACCLVWPPSSDTARDKAITCCTIPCRRCTPKTSAAAAARPAASQAYLTMALVLPRWAKREVRRNIMIPHLWTVLRGCTSTRAARARTGARILSRSFSAKKAVTPLNPVSSSWRPIDLSLLVWSMRDYSSTG